MLASGVARKREQPAVDESLLSAPALKKDVTFRFHPAIPISKPCGVLNTSGYGDT